MRPVKLTGLHYTEGIAPDAGLCPVRVDRTRLVHLDQTQTSVRCNTLGTVPTDQFDWTQATSVRCFQTQRPVS